MKVPTVGLAGFAVISFLCAPLGADTERTLVAAVAETQDSAVSSARWWPLSLVMQDDRDVMDDPAIWVHPADPALSMIIGTEKHPKGGLRLYALDGREIGFHQVGPINNVTLREMVRLGAEPVDLVAATNRELNTVMFFKVDAAALSLTELRGEPVQPSFEDEIYGICFYRSHRTGELYVFITSTDGDIEQWNLRGGGGGDLDGKLVRRLELGSQSEGCVADDVAGRLYVAEEDVGIWRFSAEPGATDNGVLIDAVGGGRLTADVEGLALYQPEGGNGYLVASSQGDSTFAVYERTGDNAFVTAFRVARPDGSHVRNTDGIQATARSIDGLFPRGLLVVHDNRDDMGRRSNFKLVPWEAVEAVIPPAR